MTKRSNSIELTAQEHVLVEAARNAWGLIRKTFEQWVTLGRGIAALRDKAAGMGGRRAFQRLLEQERLDVIDKGTISRLLKVIDNLPAVEEWRATLSQNTQVGGRLLVPSSRTARYSRRRPSPGFGARG